MTSASIIHRCGLSAILVLLGGQVAFGQTKAQCLDGCHEDLTEVSDKRHAKQTCGECHPNVADGGQVAHEEALSELPPEKVCAISGCHSETAEKQGAGAHKDSTCDSCHGALHDEFKAKGYGECKRCHKDEAAAFSKSIHGRSNGEEQVACADCHADVHAPLSKNDLLSPTSKVMQVTTCGECHDKDYVRAYRTSVHGVGLLRSGLSVAPACVDCHGAHDILKTTDPASRVSRDHITSTCGTCHAFITARWKGSTHGELALRETERHAKEGPDAGVVLGPRKTGREGPVCSSCHPGHLTFDPTVYGNHLKMADKCGECHPSQAESYRDSFHGKATRLGFQVAATCGDCHTPHEMLPVDNPKSSVHPKNLRKTCAQCHPGATEGFVGFSVHLDPKVEGQQPIVHWIWKFMTILLIGVLSFFGVHTVLWFQRSVVALVRKEQPTHGWEAFRERLEAHQASEPWVRRFVPAHVYIHVAIVVTFLTLAASGLPLKLSYLMGQAGGLLSMFGGLGVARLLHRVAGVLTFAYGFAYLGWLVREVVARKRRSILWGWQSLMPNLADLTLLWANIKWFLYLGPRPRLDRWAYWEKFDFLAVFWGIPVIGFSGLALWFPALVTDWFPGWVLNVAYVIHSDEALLATGFIFFFHFFHTHMRPEAFPLDPVIFLGALPLSRFKEERPVEYQRLEAAGELEKLLVPRPQDYKIRRAYRYGFFALSIGMLLGVVLLVAGIRAVLG